MIIPPYMEEKIAHLLQDCTFKQLKQIHAFAITNSLSRTIEIPSKLLRRSTEFGQMEYAELVFSTMTGGKYQPEVFLWNHMIRGYAYNGPYEKCIYLFEKMPARGLEPNRYTYPYILKACLELGNRRKGEEIHCQALKMGLDSIFSVSKSLLDFYTKTRTSCCPFDMGHLETGRLGDAQKIFDGMAMKPVELWNRMISEYVNLGEVEAGRTLFDEMPERDVISWNSMISGYAGDGNIESAEDLFVQMPEKNVVSWTLMIQAYGNSGDLVTAIRLFNGMPERNTVSWNSMISIYAQHGKFQDALDLFVRMHSENMVLDGFTFVSALSACAHLGALEFGKWIHFHLMEDGFQLGVIVGTSLIEMYAKCGDVDKAFRVFIKMAKKDIFCWNVMIKSLAIHGRTEDAVKVFSMMQQDGFKPNDFTFTSTLFACNHGGLVKEGCQIFESMKRDFGADPKIEHYGCLIDLLSRSGKLEEAHLLLSKMSCEPDVAIWGALLGGCRIRNDVELAEKVMGRIAELGSNESGVYVLMSNIYAFEGQWPQAVRAREKISEKRIWKKAGSSSILEAAGVGG